MKSRTRLKKSTQLITGTHATIVLAVLTMAVKWRRSSRKRGDTLPSGAPLPPEVLREVEQFIADGFNIKAMMRVRKATGWSVAEAKAYVATINETGEPPQPTWVARPPSPLPDMGTLPDEVKSLLRANRKIEAVKRVREATGWGLKASKDYVDAIEKNGVLPQGSASTYPATPDDLSAEVAQFLRANRKIDAIKRVHAVTGWGLREAKDYVDTIERTL